MKGSKRNIFVSYRGPQSRDQIEDPGQQLEDNATKSLLHLLDYGSEAVIRSILEALSEEVLGRTDIQTRTQQQLRQVEVAGRTPVLVGVSDTGRDPLNKDVAEEITTQRLSESNRRLDGVVYVGDKYLLVIEAKFQENELVASQMARYKQHLSVADEHYGTTSWVAIHDALEELRESETDLDSVSEFLIDQFVEYLELQGLEVTATASSYSGGENIVALEKYPSLNVRTNLVPEERPQYAIHFDTTDGSGYEDAYFTQEEFTMLLDKLEENHPRIRSALQSGKFGAIEDLAERKGLNGSETIAEIGDKETGRKRLQVARTDDYLVLGIRRAKPGKRYSANGYWMVTETEFEDLLTENQWTDLFSVSPDILSLR